MWHSGTWFSGGFAVRLDDTYPRDTSAKLSRAVVPGESGKDKNSLCGWGVFCLEEFGKGRNSLCGWDVFWFSDGFHI